MNPEPGEPKLFPQLADADREGLRDAAHRLLAHGSVLREEHRDLHDWCQNRAPLIEEWAALLGLKIAWLREERMVVALPETPGLLRKLRLDETLVALALWYDFHTEISDRGAGTTEVEFPLRDFNERLANKFNRLKLPSESRMREILRLLDRKNLVRLTGADDLATATVRVLPTIRFVIPFQGLEEWTRLVERFAEAPADDENPEESP
ncbi:MAG: DUF4194 domain-containing protein [Terrimicrobiaceae bacterium]